MSNQDLLTHPLPVGIQALVLLLFFKRITILVVAPPSPHQKQSGVAMITIFWVQHDGNVPSLSSHFPLKRIWGDQGAHFIFNPQ